MQQSSENNEQKEKSIQASNHPQPPVYQNYYVNNQWNNQYTPYPYYYNYQNMGYNQNMNYLSSQMGQMSFYPNYYGMQKPYQGENQYGQGQYKGGMQDDPNFVFTKDFPRVKNYKDEAEVVKVFPHYKNINAEFDPDSITHSDFFILRSTNDDDIHKAIKYQLWTSSAKNNETLSRVWRENNSKSLQVPIFLFFSVVKSQQFLGVARMTSDFEPKKSFKYWWEECKWFGSFSLEWIYVKDIREKQFEHIRDNGNPITNLTDGFKISDKSGKQMLNIFKNSPNVPNIFSAFDYMDRREEYLRRRDDNEEFNINYNIMAEKFAQNPASIRNKPGYNNNNKFSRPNKPYVKPENQKHVVDNKKSFVPTHSNQELHEIFNVTTAKKNKDKEKKKSKKKKTTKNEGTTEYNAQEGIKGEIVESSSEEEIEKKEEGVAVNEKKVEKDEQN